MTNQLERILRALAAGDQATYLRLLKAHLARVDRFLDRVADGRSRRLLSLAYHAVPSLN